MAKSHGRDAVLAGETASQTHGTLRARTGLAVEQLVAEYRALRASVFRPWAEAHPIGPAAVDEIARFHEAIDQAVAESVAFFCAEVEKRRQTFLGVLGHNLRTPLNSLSLTTELLGAVAPASLQSHVSSLSRGVDRIQALLDSLLDHSRVGLGAGMERGPVDHR